MTPNNDDILAVVLGERGEAAVSNEDAGLIASDPRTADAYRELAAIARLAESARAGEHAWRRQAVSGAVSASQSRRPQEFQVRQAGRSGYSAAMAAAAVICVALAGVFSYSLQQRSAAPVPVAVVVPETVEHVAESAAYRVAVAPAHGSVAAEFGQFTSLADSIESAADGSTLQIQAANSAEVLRVSKPLKVLAVGGTVRIGARQ